MNSWLTFSLIGPLAADACVEDRWAIHPNETDTAPSPWLSLDMGTVCRVAGLLLDWGVEHAVDYNLQVRVPFDLSVVWGDRLQGDALIVCQNEKK